MYNTEHAQLNLGEAPPVYIPISKLCLTVVQKKGKALPRLTIHLVCGQPLRRDVGPVIDNVEVLIKYPREVEQPQSVAISSIGEPAMLIISY